MVSGLDLSVMSQGKFFGCWMSESQVSIIFVRSVMDCTDFRSLIQFRMDFVEERKGVENEI